MTNKRNSTYKIGITGNICTGKSLVRNALQRLGVNTMDAEEAALNLLSRDPHRLSIRLTEHFGNEVIDNRGRLSRKKLMAILYANPDKKAFFEEKMNPVIREEAKHFMFSPIGTHMRAVEAHMLFETDTKHLYDEVWMVTAPPEQQLRRLIERDHVPLAEAQVMIDSQWPLEKKVELSDRVIDNSADIHHTETQVRKALDEIKYKFKVGI